MSAQTKRLLFAVAACSLFPASAVLAILLVKATSQIWFLLLAPVGFKPFGVVMARFGKIMAT
jgi:hypothetical protein